MPLITQIVSKGAMFGTLTIPTFSPREILQRLRIVRYITREMHKDLCVPLSSDMEHYHTAYVAGIAPLTHKEFENLQTRGGWHLLHFTDYYEKIRADKMMTTTQKVISIRMKYLEITEDSAAFLPRTPFNKIYPGKL